MNLSLVQRLFLHSFVGYPEHSRGYRFYCPNHTTRIIKTNRATFLDEINFTHVYEDLALELQELEEDDTKDVPISITLEPLPETIEQTHLEVVQNIKMKILKLLFMKKPCLSKIHNLKIYKLYNLILHHTYRNLGGLK